MEEKTAKPTAEKFLSLWKGAQHTGEEVIGEAQEYFNCEVDRQFIDDLALRTQICIKTSKLMYVHGHVLYLALVKYLRDHSDLDGLSILETGTARGFSATCMAKALTDENRSGVVYTYDILPHLDRMPWNCIVDTEVPDGRPNRMMILEPWKELTKKIKFLTGDTKKLLNRLKVGRIHFAFLDAHHDYPHLSHELKYTSQRQQSGDVIVCDDYTQYHTGRYQYPGIIRAIDEFVKEGKYTSRIFYADDGDKKRGYVYLVRK